jgi:hypothetical protein
LIRLSFDSAIHPEYATNWNGLSFRPTSEAEFDGALMTSGVVQDETVIWCLKWNQGCFDVAFYQKGTLITLQFTVSEKHSLKLVYVRKLRAALEQMGVSLNKCVHVGVREKDWTEFQFEEAEGQGRQVEEDKPEFEIDICYSPPFKRLQEAASSA